MEPNKLFPAHSCTCTIHLSFPHEGIPLFLTYTFNLLFHHVLHVSWIMFFKSFNRHCIHKEQLLIFFLFFPSHRLHIVMYVVFNCIVMCRLCVLQSSSLYCCLKKKKKINHFFTPGNHTSSVFKGIYTTH